MTEYASETISPDDTATSDWANLVQTQYQCAKEEFEEGNWQQKKDLLPDGDATRSYGSEAARLKAVHAERVRVSGIHLRDDFMAADLDARWHKTLTGGSAEIGADEVGGALVLSTGSVINENAAVDHNGKRSISVGKNFDLEVRAALTDVSDALFRIGVRKDDENYAAFYRNPSTGKFAVASIVNVAGTVQDSSITADTAYHVFRIKAEGGHILFYLDGDLVVDSPDAYASPMEPYMLIQNNAAAVKQLKVDYVDIYQER